MMYLIFIYVRLTIIIVWKEKPAVSNKADQKVSFCSADFFAPLGIKSDVTINYE